MQFQKCYLKKPKNSRSPLTPMFFFSLTEPACFVLVFVYGAKGGRGMKYFWVEKKHSSLKAKVSSHAETISEKSCEPGISSLISSKDALRREDWEGKGLLVKFLIQFYYHSSVLSLIWWAFPRKKYQNLALCIQCFADELEMCRVTTAEGGGSCTSSASFGIWLCVHIHCANS